jgi:hypothetical protein
MSELLVWDQFARDLAAARGEEWVRDFCRTLTDEQRAEEEVAFASQQRIATATERLDNCWMAGLGECHMRVDQESISIGCAKRARVWNDKSFIREFKRDNPDVRVLTKVARPWSQMNPPATTQRVLYDVARRRLYPKGDDVNLDPEGQEI